jgi:hypothetical protein
MAEIKSTIELMMERTKNLTMTGEEKAQLRQKELTEKARGWLVRYLDGILSLESLKAEMMQESEDIRELKKILQPLIGEYIDPERDQERLFPLLIGLFDVDASVLTGTLDTYRTQKKALYEKRAEEMLVHLGELGIEGSAVVANPDKDRDSGDQVLKDEFRDRIAVLMDSDRS